jgi:hypothetical protein
MDGCYDGVELMMLVMIRYDDNDDDVLAVSFCLVLDGLVGSSPG